MTPRLKAANTQEGFPSENTYDHNNSSDHTNNNTVHKTLLEIHRISDHEIEKRKELLYFTDNDRDILESMRSKIELNVDKIVSDFYKQQVQFPEITLIIGDAETMQRLQISMRSYIMDICSGFYDAEYVNRRLRIGKVHQRIGLPPKTICILFVSYAYNNHEVYAGSERS